MKITDLKIVKIIKEDISRFPVTMYILLTLTLLWPLCILVTGDTNLIIIAIGLLIALAAYIPEVLTEERKLVNYIISIVLTILGGIIFYFIIAFIYILIFKYKKSGKSFWNYTKSVIKIFLYFAMAFYVEVFIVMFAVFGGSSISTSGNTVLLQIELFAVIELGVLLFGLVFMPKIFYKISEL